MTAAIDVLTFGESMVSFRSVGPMVLGGPLTPHLAGAESNVAIGVVRLGHTASWAGRLGADSFGQLALRELRAEGVDTEHSTVDPGLPTGLMFLEQRSADLSRVEYRRAGSAASALSVEHVRAAVEAGPRFLHLTGITPALSESARAAVQWAAESASAAGVFVSLDVNYRGRLWTRDEARSALAPLLRHVRLLIASDDELDLAAPGGEEEAVATLLHHGVEQVAVKRGGAGATLWSGSGRLDSAVVPVTVVDTVGAGDAFTAGLLSGLLDGLEGKECLRRATTAGAFAVSTRGDWEGLPRRDELGLLDGHAPGATLR